MVIRLINLGNLTLRLYKTVLDNLDIKPDNIILDVGFGNGYFISKILKKNIPVNIYGIDISNDMVNHASKKYKRFVQKGNLNFSLANIQETSFENDKFDKIYTISTVYFWKDMKKCFSEVKRILKPNGLFLNVIYTKAFLETIRYTTYGFDKYTVEELIKITEENGMKVIKTIEIVKKISYCVISENIR